MIIGTRPKSLDAVYQKSTDPSIIQGAPVYSLEDELELAWILQAGHGARDVFRYKGLFIVTGMLMGGLTWSTRTYAIDIEKAKIMLFCNGETHSVIDTITVINALAALKDS